MPMYPNQKKYDRENTCRVAIKLNLNTDREIIDKLQSVKNKQGYIKSLIINDIAKEKQP